MSWTIAVLENTIKNINHECEKKLNKAYQNNCYDDATCVNRR